MDHSGPLDIKRFEIEGQEPLRFLKAPQDPINRELTQNPMPTNQTLAFSSKIKTLDPKYYQPPPLNSLQIPTNPIFLFYVASRSKSNSTLNQKSQLFLNDEALLQSFA